LTGGPDQGLSYNTGLSAPGPRYTSTVRSLYYGAAEYEDWVLGRFVETVEDRGRPTVVVLMSDHGEHLGEHGLFNHNSSLHQALLHVPLVLWTQGVELGQGQIEQPLSLLLLAGWLLGLAEGADAGPPSPDGPVQSEYEGTARHNGLPPAVAEHIGSGASRVPALVLHPGLAVRDGPIKYVAIGNGDEHVFELSSDPGEDRDLAPSSPHLIERYAPFREQWEGRRRSQAEPPTIGQVAEDEVAEHLRELGYIE
jgi:arylsulfatase A-like enzyme